MNAEELLARFTIPSPCSARWESMPGGDLVRSCGACGKHVHELSAMSLAQVESLLHEQGGELCGRIAVDRDGEGILAGTEAARAPFRFRLRTLMAIIAGIAAALGLARLLSDSPPQRHVMGGLSTRVGGEILSSDEY